MTCLDYTVVLTLCIEDVRMPRMFSILTVMLLSAQAAASTPAVSTACDKLAALALPNTTIASAQLVPAGPFTPPAPQGPPGGPVAPNAQAGGRGGPAGGRGQGPAAPQITLPAHCRVQAVLKPSSDSHIEMEVWLPAENWNGKFQAVGNGGWAGTISYAAMGTALQEGYAAASNDTGHKGGSANFAIDHPEKLVDFAYRAVHEMTVQSKAIINKYYNRAPRLSYWNGCSTGGRQGLMSAQKYPEDFDAIVAGAPANYQTHLHAWDLSVTVPVSKNPASAVPAAKLQLLNNAVIAACDGNDGVKDGLLNDPRACRFDAATLQCRAGAGDDCLTADQVATVKRLYAPAKTTSGEVVFPGKDYGSELGWTANQSISALPAGSFVVAYNDPKWDAAGFDLDRDLKVVDEKVGSIVNAINPDLRAFKARGGKLILYHGWNDTAISPGNAIDYYTSVLKRMGGRQDDFVRLYMAPGMNHCGGGVGPNQINWMRSEEHTSELQSLAYLVCRL